ncbi:hypothetical protein TNCV_4005731 [Trichonephila clavipes]|nr:hypothetical protein TNCV_4005731 [Trichonephila clavipes]
MKWTHLALIPFRNEDLDELLVDNIRRINDVIKLNLDVITDSEGYNGTEGKLSVVKSISKLILESLRLCTFAKDADIIARTPPDLKSALLALEKEAGKIPFTANKEKLNTCSGHTRSCMSDTGKEPRHLNPRSSDEDDNLRWAYCLLTTTPRHGITLSLNRLTVH